MTKTNQVAVERRRKPLDATVVVPGSKSLTNRALVCAALANDSSKLFNIAPGDDTIAMVAGLNAMGAHCVVHGDDVEIEAPINRTWTDDVMV
ncbi:MAG: hypothetical protein AAB088_02945, partial [Actinomycetota bacterium]